MKEVYRKQIDALLSGDVETLNKIYGRNFRAGPRLINSVWASTGGCKETSIFAELNGCGNCPTSVRYHQVHRNLRHSYNIDLEFDELIPVGPPPENWKPTREVLEHFAKLQEFAETGSVE